jgi:hypothetical protein
MNLLIMPYGKFVHGIYRSGDSLKWALERSRAAASVARLALATAPATLSRVRWHRMSS